MNANDNHKEVLPPILDGLIPRRRLLRQAVLRSSLAIAILGCGLGAGLGVAYAYITGSGAGTGTAVVGSMQTVTIDAMAQNPSESLLPGGTGDATFAVDNPNPVAVTLVSVAQNGTISVSGGSGCTPANSGVSFTNQTGLSIAIPANATDVNVDLPTAMSMASNAANGCQDATFSVPISITVNQG